MMRAQRNYREYIAKKQHEYGDKFDPSGLAVKFQHHFESGMRIRIRFSHGEEMTGTVGVTTGWKPSFLLMRTSRSLGSPWLLGRDDEVIGVTKYQGR